MYRDAHNPLDCEDGSLSPPRRPAQERYRSKGGHPWRSDVLLQRNSAMRVRTTGRSSQYSRTSFKQLMQQRRSVYSSPAVVVPEEDTDVYSIEDSQSSAYSLQQSQHDEISLGGVALSPQPDYTITGTKSTSCTTSPRNLHPPQDNKEPSELTEMQLQRNKERELKQDLERRLKWVYTGDHHCIESYGAGGRKVQSPALLNPDDRIAQVLKNQLRHALNERLTTVYTGDYNVVEGYGVVSEEKKEESLSERTTTKPMWEQEPSEGQAPLIPLKVLKCERRRALRAPSPPQTEDGTGQRRHAILVHHHPYRQQQHADAMSTTPQVPADLRNYHQQQQQKQQHERHMQVANVDELICKGRTALHDYRTDEQVEDVHDAIDDSLAAVDELYTTTSSSSSSSASGEEKQAQQLQTMPGEAKEKEEQPQVHDDDDDCRTHCTEYTEYTVEETVAEVPHLPTIEPTVAAATGSGSDDDDDDYTEYTIEETVAGDRSLMMPGPISLASTQQQSATNHHHHHNDDEWDEYTVEETVVEAPVEEQQHHHEEEEWDEYTVEEVAEVDDGHEQSITMMPGPITHASGEWDEYTVEETIAEESVVSAEVPPSTVGGVEDEEERDIETVDDSEAPYITVTRTSPSSQDRDDWTACTELTEDFAREEEPYINNRHLPGYFATAKTASDEAEGEEEEEKFYECMGKNDETETTVDVTAGSDGDEESEFVNDEGTGIRSYCSNTSSNSRTGSTRSSMEPSRTTELLRRDIWSPDADVVESALKELSQEAAQGRENRACIVKFGGFLAILRAMEVNLRHPGVQAAACVAMDKLSTDPDNRVAISQVGGVQAMILAMQEHADDVAVQQAACSALVSTTNHDAAGDIVADGAVETIATSMSRYSSYPVVQEKAFGALANLCLDNRERLKALSGAGGLTTMTMALQRPWQNASDKQEAISTLSMLLRVLAESDH